MTDLISGEDFAKSLLADAQEKAGKLAESVPGPPPQEGWVREWDSDSFDFSPNMPGIARRQWMRIQAREVEIEILGKHLFRDGTYAYVRLHFKPKPEVMREIRIRDKGDKLLTSHPTERLSRL